MKGRICLGLFLIVIIGALFFQLKDYYLIVNASSPSSQIFEVLFDDSDTKPLTSLLGETEIINNSIELWHYSGGYWKYKDLVIRDEELGLDLSDEESLSGKLNVEVVFEISVAQNLYKKLIERGNIRVVCSTTLKKQKTLDSIKLTELFYDRPTIELKDNKIYFKSKPKLHFYRDNSYEEIIGDIFNVIIPIVDPDYGYNSYAIWKKNAAVDWGAINGYFDKDDPFAIAPEGVNLLAPSQIKNASGHLYDGFTFKTGDITRISDESSVGHGTFRNGGAVGIVFNYPIKFTFYSDETPMDLSAQFETLPSSAVRGKKVQVCVIVKSNFETDLENVPFKWEITKAGDTPLNFSDKLEYSGSSKLPSGTVNILSKTKQKVFYADFIMPDSNVNVKFSINEEGTVPIEINPENNTIDSEEAIEVVENISYIGKLDLDYNVLSRKVSFSLADGTDIKAKLILKKGHWEGNAEGKLNVEKTADVYHDFLVTENNDNTICYDKINESLFVQAVDEESATIVRNPLINTTVKRTDFEDNPLGYNWLNLKNPFEPLLKTGKVAFAGSVSRGYEYKEYYNYRKKEDGGIQYDERTVNTSTSAHFNSGTDTREIRAFIYNGRADMPDVSSRNFMGKVETNGWERKLFWTSDAYKFDVIRWMCHIDEDNKPYNWTKVDGQYKRTFTQQNTASINWSVKNSMSSLYSYDRENARKMNYGKAYYPNVVFASDKGLQKYDWPIKSGYYFNPLGEYTCTVKTVQYKNTPDTTKEHTELVDKIKNSFHYTSNMLYTSDGKTYQSLDLHNGNDKIFGMDMFDITTEYSKSETKLEHYDDSAYADKTHKFFKEILEGYSESNTEDSRENFKYREYIKQGDIYKVEETTVITFRVAPPSNGKKLYTYIGMKDGQYIINAGVDNFTLDKYMYNELKVNGLWTIDNITVTVNGTLYDDQNSIIGN